MDFGAFGCQGEIHEVSSVASVGEVPFKLVCWVIQVGLELKPGSVIGGGIGNGPETKDVVNESSVEEEVVREIVQEFLLIDGIVQNASIA